MKPDNFDFSSVTIENVALPPAPPNPARQLLFRMKPGESTLLPPPVALYVSKLAKRMRIPVECRDEPPETRVYILPPSTDDSRLHGLMAELARLARQQAELGLSPRPETANEIWPK